MEEAQATASDVGRRHRPHGAAVEEAGASLPDGLEETGAAPMWKREGQVIRAAWATNLKRAVQMRARETELARAAHDSERTGWSGHRRPGRRRCPDVRTLVLLKIVDDGSQPESLHVSNLFYLSCKRIITRRPYTNASIRVNCFFFVFSLYTIEFGDVPSYMHTSCLGAHTKPYMLPLRA